MSSLTRLFALLFCASLVAARTRVARNTLTGPDGVAKRQQQVFMENAQQCLAQGGVCTLGSGCPASLRYTSDVTLCGDRPELVCCAKLPVTESVCSERGGECVDPGTCHNGPRDTLGVCPPGEVCCVWVV